MTQLMEPWITLASQVVIVLRTSGRSWRVKSGTPIGWRMCGLVVTVGVTLIRGL